MRRNQKIYGVAAGVLKNCLVAKTGKHADPRDVDHDKYMKQIGDKFPVEDKDVLKKIADWAIYWEYLR